MSKKLDTCKNILELEVVFMNTYEELQEEACNDGIEIIDNYVFKSERISGLYCDSTIALSKNYNLYN